MIEVYKIFYDYTNGGVKAKSDVLSKYISYWTNNPYDYIELSDDEKIEIITQNQNDFKKEYK